MADSLPLLAVGLAGTHLQAWPNFILNRGCVLSHWQSVTAGKNQLEHAVNTYEDYSFFQSLHRGEKKKTFFLKCHRWAAVERR